jgi:hypothetical protein
MSANRRFRSKQTQQMADKIKAACPSAVISLKVTGPKGTAFIPSKPGDLPWSTGQSRTKLANYAGIYI